jgi:hypothetical protein
MGRFFVFRTRELLSHHQFNVRLAGRLGAQLLFARIGLNDVREHAKGSSLASAVVTKKPDDCAWRYRLAQVVPYDTGITIYTALG